MKEQFISGLPEEFGTKKRVKYILVYQRSLFYSVIQGAFIPIPVPFLA
jgi:hypothetical protein